MLDILNKAGGEASKEFMVKTYKSFPKKPLLIKQTSATYKRY